MISRKQNNSDDLENLYAKVRNDGIKIIFHKFGKKFKFRYEYSYENLESTSKKSV
jgi:hypothetical protein